MHPIATVSKPEPQLFTVSHTLPPTEAGARLGGMGMEVSSLFHRCLQRKGYIAVFPQRERGRGAEEEGGPVMHTCFGRGVEECFWLILMLTSIANKQQIILFCS